MEQLAQLDYALYTIRLDLLSKDMTGIPIDQKRIKEIFKEFEQKRENLKEAMRLCGRIAIQNNLPELPGGMAKMIASYF